ncbi:MAG: hypothetical protein M3317_11210 [Actinomycetota bacterium]|nr:hypothetical protein [Actinomycetota bacterium]
MGMRDRLRRLEQATEGERTVLVCPECGEESTLYGDQLLEYLAREWAQGYQGELYGLPPDPAVVKLSEHEHDSSLMINKAIGKPWVGKLHAGTVGMPDDVQDLSEP